jgi:hypothetical protein
MDVIDYVIGSVIVLLDTGEECWTDAIDFFIEHAVVKRDGIPSFRHVGLLH